MRKEVLQASAAVAGTIAFTVAFAEYEPAVEVALSATPKAVDIGSLPAHLPAAVRRQSDRAVVIRSELITQLKHHRSGIEASKHIPYFGSGFRISNDIYLSAGHMVTTNVPGEILDDRGCGDLMVDTPTSNVTSYTIGPTFARSSKGGTIPSHKFTGSFNSFQVSKPDISLVKAPNNHPKNDLRLPPLTRTRYVNGWLPRGSDVYMVNYEPTSKGTLRDPDQDGLSEQALRRHLAQPAILGGVIIDYYKHKYVVAEGLKSYGASFDKYSRPGASGGGVVTPTGHLAGELIRAATPMTVKRLGHMFNVHLTGKHQSSLVSYALVQPVSKTMIQAMEQSLQVSKPCQAK